MTNAPELVKVSGEVFRKPAFLDWFVELIQTNSNVSFSLYVGARDDINDYFKSRGWNHLVDEVKNPMGREPENLEQERAIRRIQNRNRNECRDLLRARGILIPVFSDYIKVGEIYCPIDGDELARIAFIKYGKIRIVTTPDRKDKKEKKLAYLSRKVEVIDF